MVVGFIRTRDPNQVCGFLIFELHGRFRHYIVPPMDDVVSKALKRKRELQAELAEIEQFLRLHRKISGEPASAYREHLSDAADPVLDFGNGDISELARTFRRASERLLGVPQRGRPADFADLAARIIKDAGEPLTRGAIVKEMDARGVAIPSGDKERYIGTILWRQQHRFINFEGIGYWLKSEPYEAMNYQPEDDGFPDASFPDDVSDDDYAN